MNRIRRLRAILFISLLVFAYAVVACESQSLSSVLGSDDGETDAVESVGIQPSAATLGPGETQQFSVEARDANDELIPVEGEVQWSATGGTITSDGLYTAGSDAGEYEVVASHSSGLADTASVTIDATAADVWFEEDFSTYGSVSGDPTTDFKDDVNGWYGDWNVEAEDEPRATIETGISIPGLGSDRQVWRQEQNFQCKPGHGPGRELNLPTIDETEIWVEVYVYFSASYKTDWETECGDVANPDHKFIFFNRHGGLGTDRWDIKVGTFGDLYTLAAPQSINQRADPCTSSEADLPCAQFNDQWQLWRFHLKSASANDVPDGILRWKRLDPETLGVLTDVNGNAYDINLAPDEKHDGFTHFDLGKTFNLGPQGEQFWRWGRIRVWKADPGWGW